MSIIIRCDCCKRDIPVDKLYHGYTEIIFYPGTHGNEYTEYKQLCPECLKEQMAQMWAKAPVAEVDPWGDKKEEEAK